MYQRADQQALLLSGGGNYVPVQNTSSWQQAGAGTVGRQQNKPAPSGRTLLGPGIAGPPQFVPAHTLTPVAQHQLSFNDNSGPGLVTGQQRGQLGQLVMLSGAQQQQQPQQQQLVQLHSSGGQVFSVQNGTRVIKAGMSVQSTGGLGVARTQALQQQMQQAGQANKLTVVHNMSAPSQHLLVAQSAQQAAMGLGQGGPRPISVQPLHVQAPSGFQALGVRQGQVQSQSPMPVQVGAQVRNTSGSLPVSVQAVYAAQASSCAMRPGARIPKLGTVATYNPVTGVRSATTNAPPGSGGGVMPAPMLPTGLPPTLVQQVQKANLLQQQQQQQQQLQQAGLQGLMAGSLHAQPVQVRTLGSGMNILGPQPTSNPAGGSQRQTTLLVGPNGFTTPQLGNAGLNLVSGGGVVAIGPQSGSSPHQFPSSGSSTSTSTASGSQVVQVTLADGTTATTVMDQATLVRMLSESARGQATAKLQHQQRQLQQNSLAASTLGMGQMGRLQGSGSSGSSQSLEVMGGLHSQRSSGGQQQAGSKSGGRPPPPPPPPLSAQQHLLLQQQPGMPVQGRGPQGLGGGMGLASDDISAFNTSMLFADASALAQLQGFGAGGPQDYSSQLAGMTEGLSVVDLNALLDPHQGQQPVGMSVPSHPPGRSGSFNSSQVSSEDAAALAACQQQNAAAPGEEGSGLGLGALGFGQLGGGSREDLKTILVSIGQELARHSISVETAVTSGWLGVLTANDVAILAGAYADEERRMGQGAQQGQGSNGPGGAAQAQQAAMFLSLGLSGGANSQGGAAATGYASAPAMPIAHAGSHGAATPAMSSGSLQHQGPAAGADSPRSVGGAAGSNDNERSVSAGLLVMTTSARTSHSKAPSEEGSMGRPASTPAVLDGQAPPSQLSLAQQSGSFTLAPLQPLQHPGGRGLGSGSAPSDSRPDSNSLLGLGGFGGGYGGYGLFAPGSGLGLGLHGEQAHPGLGADHERMPVEALEADAGALAEMFGEKPWSSMGLVVMAEELALSAQGPMGGAGGERRGKHVPGAFDSASEYEARHAQAAAAANRALSGDCHALLGMGGGGAAGGGGMPPSQYLTPAASAVTSSTAVAAEAAAAASEGGAKGAAEEALDASATDPEMINRFATLDLGCGFY